MNRGSKEFYEVRASFEKAIKEGLFGYLPNDLTKEDFDSSTFYANGAVNTAFRVYCTGYSSAKCAYQNS